MENLNDLIWVSALSGTLGGLIAGTAAVSSSLIAHRASAKRDREERKYRDRTRFHDGRVETYAAFLAASSELRAAVRLTHEGKWKEDAPLSKKTIYESTAAVSEGLGQIQLIGSEPVKQAAENLFTAVNNLRKEGAEVSDKNLQDVLETSLVSRHT